MYTTLDLIKSLMNGAGVTILVLVYSTVLAGVLAFIVGFMKLANYRLIRYIATIYIEIFRGTSLLVQLFWLYFALPLLGVELSAMTAGVLALGLNYGAYGAEVVRSSIQAVPKQQVEAAIALNMTMRQKYQIVILPQAIRMMIPTFGNLLIELLKGTALVSLVTLSDLTFQAMTLITSTMQTTKIFILLLLFYFIIAFPLTRFMKWLERKYTVGKV